MRMRLLICEGSVSLSTRFQSVSMINETRIVSELRLHLNSHETIRLYDFGRKAEL